MTAEDDDFKQHLREAIVLLDIAVPHFAIQARREKESYNGTGLQEITCQRRLEMVMEMICRIGPKVGYDPEYWIDHSRGQQ